MRVGLPYVAGFFDGEGSVGIYRSGEGAYFLRTQLCQNRSARSQDLFDDLQRRFGGAVSPQKTRTGRIKLNWQLSGQLALVFLLAIEPDAVLKRDQIRLAISWQHRRPTRVRRSDRGQFRKAEFSAEDQRVAGALARMKK